MTKRGLPERPASCQELIATSSIWRIDAGLAPVPKKPSPRWPTLRTAAGASPPMRIGGPPSCAGLGPIGPMAAERYGARRTEGMRRIRRVTPATAARVSSGS
jgi:hypothetical protein